MRLKLANRLCLALALAGLILFNLSHDPGREERSNELLFANPWVFKALSGPAHNLLADGLWLLSNTVSEIGMKSTTFVDKEKFYLASQTIAVMDPYFFKANNYAVTFLASIHHDVDKALKLIRLTRSFDSENFLLYFNEIVILLIYGVEAGVEVDYKDIINLAKRSATLPDYQKHLGAIDVSDWLEDILITSHSKLHRREQAMEDLIWLYKNTKDPARKAQIQTKIDELKTISKNQIKR